MPYAEVSVNSPIAQRRTFSYGIPDGLSLNIGQAVWVPFGAKTLQGIVIELTPFPAVEETREIAGIIDSTPLLTPVQVSLAQWLSISYLAPLFESVALLLPPGFERRVITFLSPAAGISETPEDLSSEQKEVLESVRLKERVTLRELEKQNGIRRVQKIIPQLLHRHLIVKSYQLEKVRVKPKIVPFLRLKVSPEEALKVLDGYGQRALKKAGLLRFLTENTADIEQKIALRKSGSSIPSAKALARDGLIEMQEVRVDRDPLPSRSINLSLPLPLTGAQESVLQSIRASLFRAPPPGKEPVPGPSLDQGGIKGDFMPPHSNSLPQGARGLEREENPGTLNGLPLSCYQREKPDLPSPASALPLKGDTNRIRFDPPGNPEVFLLRGVTGSGKTEVYLQALEAAVKQGKRGIVLVPEIAMTPQIIERFVSRFPGRVAVLHSELSLGEQFDEWWRIKNGEFDVVIGPRSAIFAPQPDLGLIIIDEEHEWTYKQDDSPRYHTREVALKLAELTGATVVLGSATPDVESYFRALNNEFHLLELPERVTPDEGSPLPQVEIVDLKAELKAGNLSLFSRSLHSSIETALKNSEQIMLFLNRRGAASFVECRNCGWVIRCKRCEVPLSYHYAEEILVCHQCNYHIKVPEVCPRCQSRRIKYLGVGTEKLEQETAQIFPQARLLRWDSDIVQGHSQAHQEIFEKFKAGEADILIGTQMIAKGLDIPGVTLVGVISADIALNLPDFRAGERTFQLLSQVAGRAGRGLAGGKVIIQTYSPEHYAIQAAARHDYLAFYRKEMSYRRELNHPPFSRLARLTFTHTNDSHCREEAERMKRIILEERDARGLADISLIGPAPAFIHRLRGKFRWQIILRSSNPSSFLSAIPFPRGWSVDIDPVGI